MTEQTSSKSNIVMLPIDILSPHPDNPRKDVGDVSELAESIKVNGVLQNLTVVPYFSPGHKQEIPGLYTVIIGHRRLAAAKEAGLTEVPCAIARMSEKEQLSTMLTENMQRVDLTVYEQAQGFQMMLNMGDTVEEIAEKSGFSKTTVRKRLEIAKLDGKKLKKVTQERQVTLADFDKLAEIEDIEIRNNLLSSIGTPNFKNDLYREMNNQKTAYRIVEWLKTVKTFATEITKDELDRDAMNYVCNYSWYNLLKDVAVPDDADKVKYFFIRSEKQIDIYKERDLAREKIEQEARNEHRRKQDEKFEEWRDISCRHYDLRMEFVKSLANSACVISFGKIMVFLTAVMSRRTGYSGPHTDVGTFCYCMGVQAHIPDRVTDPLEIPGVKEAVAAFPGKAALCLAYSTADSAGAGYWTKDWSPDIRDYVYNHRKNEQLDSLYKLLCHLGYEMSDEERQMQDGSHESFRPSGDDEEDPCSLCKSAHPTCDKCCLTCKDHCNAWQSCRKEK